MIVELIEVTQDPIFVISKCARTCYNSWDKFDRSKGIAFIKGLIKSGHESPLEAATAIFEVSDISRSCLAQLTRHRIGVSFCVQSQRYVDQNKSGYVIPPDILNNSTARSVYENALMTTRAAYRELLQLGIKKEDARMVLTESTCTKLTMTVNFRELRHIFELRTHPTAQWEIRELCQRMASELDKRSLRWVYEDILEKNNISFS